MAGGVGLLGSAFFSSVLQLDRAEFVLAHAVLVGAFPVRQLRHHWLRGLLGGLLFGAILFRGVVAQPASAAPRDGQLAMGLAWFGYLVTGSPLAPIVSHVIMHGAAVVHGMNPTMQLPPHY